MHALLHVAHMVSPSVAGDAPTAALALRDADVAVLLADGWKAALFSRGGVHSVPLPANEASPLDSLWHFVLFSVRSRCYGRALVVRQPVPR
jgi:hypothetical protein